MQPRITPRRVPRARGSETGDTQTGGPMFGGVATHTHLEADITDLQAYLVSPLTTDGDVLYYNSGHQRLAKGSDTEVLTLASGVPTWAAPASGYTDPLTTDGDILIRDTTTKRLGKGSDGEVLTLASGLPSWAAAGGGIAVTVSTSAPSGSANDGDLWCRV